MPLSVVALTKREQIAMENIRKMPHISPAVHVVEAMKSMKKKRQRSKEQSYRNAIILPILRDSIERQEKRSASTAMNKDLNGNATVGISL